MRKRYIEKTGLREVDVTKYYPIIKHPQVIRLKDITQLSFVDTKYRGATHSRLEHSDVVLHFTDEITNHLVEKECITPYEKINLEIASIVHDIGHMPFSHAGEFVATKLGRKKRNEHNAKAIELIESEEKDRSGKTLRENIEECKGDPEFVKEIISKKNYLSKIISHNTLGSDKIGYVLLDVNKTNFQYSMPFFLDIFPYYYFDGKRLGLEDEEKVPQIKNIQTAYQDMYLYVYFHPNVRFYERVFEKAIETLIKNNIISVDELWDIEEFELKHLMKYNDKTRELFEKIQYEILDEKLFSINLSKEDKKQIEYFSNPLNLSEIERTLADEFGCNQKQITCQLVVIPEKVIPEDVFIFEENKSLFEKYPLHYKNLVDTAYSHTRMDVYKESELKINEKDCKRIVKNLF